MHKLLSAAAAATLLACCTSTGQAFWIDAFLAHCEEGYCKNSRWPSPYVCPDRISARAPFNTMVENGWRRQNLLGSHHFNEDATALTQAGALKVHWIMTQAPQQYRRMFVERSLAEGVTQQRIATATQYATRFAGEGAEPSVSDTHLVSEGRPAATVDFVNSQFRENMRVPVLPANSLGTGSSTP